MSEWIADLYVNGHPRPQGSMSYVGKGRMVHSPRLMEWRKTIFAAIDEWISFYGNAWEPITGPVEVDMKFYLPKARSNRDAHPTNTRSGDCDKLIRAANDAISLGETRLIADDAQVLRIRGEKFWALGMPGEDGHVPGMRLRVRPHE